jgi:hypothetical protein
MNFICCLPNCPPLISNINIYSSDDNLHRHSNILFEQTITSYAKEFTRRFSFSYYRKDFSIEFDRISLGDIQDVSFYLIKIDFIIIRFFRILKDDSLIK